METILVAYREEEEDIPNAFQLEVFLQKEVYLIDILHYLSSLQSASGQDAISGLGCFNYHYFAESNDTLVSLKSPTSIVPFNARGFISLVLFRCGFPPVIPAGQASLYLEKSRRELYSSRSYKEASSWRAATPSTFQKLSDILPQSNALQSATLSHLRTSRVNGILCDSQRGPPEKPLKQTKPQLHAQHNVEQQHRQRYEVEDKKHHQTRHDTPPSPTPYSDDEQFRKMHREQHHYKQRDQGANQKHATQFVNDDTVNAIADAAKETARSFFNFAATSFKTVAEVAATVSATGVASTLTVSQVGETRINIIKEIAEGAFGTVYLAHDSANPAQQYAMKLMLCQTKEQIVDAQNELQALQRFRGHENIVRLIDHSSSASKQHSNGTREFRMLFPIFHAGTAWDAIERASPQESVGCPWPFTERRALSVLMGATRGILAMHERGFSHRDVKPHNILLSDEDNAVVMDLGSVTVARLDVTSRQQALIVEEEAASKTSAAYRAPELTNTPHPTRIDERVDIWGLGCTLYALAFGRSPFESPREGVLRLAILNGRYSLPSDRRSRDCTFSTGFEKLIESMLQVDHSNRPFAQEVIEHCERLIAQCPVQKQRSR